MWLGSLDPQRGGGPGRRGVWAAIVVIVLTAAIPAFSVAEFVFSQPAPRVLSAGCFFTAAALLWACYLGPGPWSWGTVVRGAVTGISIVLLVGSAVLGYVGLNGDSESELRVAAEFDVPGHPVKGVVDARNRTLLFGDRGGLVRGFDIATQLPIGDPQRIGRSIGDLVWRRGFLFATVNEGELTRVRFGPAQRPAISVRYGTENGDIAVGANSIWVTDRVGGRVLRFNFELERIATIRLSERSGAQATSLAIGGPNLVWVTDSGLNALYRINARTNQVVVSKSVLPNPSAVLIVGNVVYVTHPGIRTLVKHDRLTGKQTSDDLMRIAPGPSTLNAAAGLLYVCNVQSNQVQPFSLRTGKRTGSALSTGLSPTDLVVGPSGREMWVTNSGSGSVTPIEIGS